MVTSINCGFQTFLHFPVDARTSWQVASLSSINEFLGYVAAMNEPITSTFGSREENFFSAVKTLEGLMYL